MKEAVRLQVGDCRVDILPVVNGLVTEADRVKEAFGDYDAYGASMGLEGLDAISKREEIGTDDISVSELDIVYAKKMSAFGEVQVPSPAFCELVDLCKAKGKTVIPLDMSDYDYDTAYMECVSAVEFTSEHHLAKKGLKARMDAADPHELACMWDEHISSIRGYRKLNIRREEHIAAEIADTAKYRKSLLAVIETERADGIAALLRERYGAR